MTDTDNSGREGGIDALALARRVRELELEVQPGRDLWPGIERRIADYPQKPLRQAPDTHRLLPWAVAASLLVAVTALSLNLLQLQRIERNVPLAAVESIEQAYGQVRQPMVAKFVRVNQSLDEQTRDDLGRNLEIMLQARHEVLAELRRHPDNRRLRDMLIRLHEQELALLRQDFTTPGRAL